MPLSSVLQRWRRLGDAALTVSVICEAEVLQGLIQLSSQSLWKLYDEVLAGRLPILPIDERVGRCFAEFSARAEQRAASGRRWTS